ncbi:DUF1194 domain-containing protein [Rhizobium sp. OAE497]|uniref:DUF1194 domain-containing protein n=1 Tax=Rhizobium sp. OAE497 TaxID=2663796 RepID=UPI0018F4B986
MVRTMMRRWLLHGAVAGVLLSICMTSDAAASERIDLALVIAADVSTSMDPREKAMQQEGFVAAFRQPEIIDAIGRGKYGRIAVAYFEWGGDHGQRMVIPWTLLKDEADCWMFSLRLAENSPTKLRRGTSISEALSYSASLLRQSGYAPERLVVNISSDGINSIGRDVEPVRRELIAGGMTINALVISARGEHDDDEPPLSPEALFSYFHREVIGGPGAFAMPVRSAADYPSAIYRKLLREIGGFGEIADKR